jgi:hypothetical protein
MIFSNGSKAHTVTTDVWMCCEFMKQPWAYHANKECFEVEKVQMRKKDLWIPSGLGDATLLLSQKLMPYYTYCKRDNFVCCCLDTSLLSRHVHLRSRGVTFLRSSPSNSQSLFKKTRPGCSKSGVSIGIRFAISWSCHPFAESAQCLLLFWKVSRRKQVQWRMTNRHAWILHAIPFSGFRQLYHICFTTSLYRKILFLQQERKSCILVTSQNCNDWLRWERLALVKDPHSTAPSWDSLVAKEKHLTLWHYDLMCVTRLLSFAVCIRPGNDDSSQ